MTTTCTFLFAGRPGAHNHQDWQHRHNVAINEHGAAGFARKAPANEAVVLDLARAIHTLTVETPDAATDGYGLPNITEPLIEAFRHLLNYDLGRLDGGILSAWIEGVAEDVGVQ